MDLTTGAFYSKFILRETAQQDYRIPKYYLIIMFNDGQIAPLGGDFVICVNMEYMSSNA